MQRLAQCKDDDLEEAEEEEEEEDYDEDDDEGESIVPAVCSQQAPGHGLILCLLLDEEDWTDAYLAQNA